MINHSQFSQSIILIEMYYLKFTEGLGVPYVRKESILGAQGWY